MPALGKLVCPLGRHLAGKTANHLRQDHVFEGGKVREKIEGLEDDAEMAPVLSWLQTQGEMVNAWTSTRPGHELLAEISAAGVPCGKVNTAMDLLNDDLESPRGLFEEAGDGMGGRLRLPANCMGFERGFQEYPELGGDTGEVMAPWLNLSSSDVLQATAAGAFGSD